VIDPEHIGLPMFDSTWALFQHRMPAGTELPRHFFARETVKKALPAIG
jgi:hypothetical protein